MCQKATSTITSTTEKVQQKIRSSTTKIQKESSSEELNSFKAARLADNLDFWKSITDEYVLLLAKGMNIEINMADNYRELTYAQEFSDQELVLIMEKEIAGLAKMRVIEKAYPCLNQFLSGISLTPKKDGRFS